VIELVFSMLLAWLPGIIAEQRKHRHAMLVSVVGFAGLFIHPLLWMIALLWAWKGPTRP
jgi:hypothetical protein